MAIITYKSDMIHQVQKQVRPPPEQLQDAPEQHIFAVIAWRIFAKRAKKEFTLDHFPHTIKIGLKAVELAVSYELKTLIATDVYKYVYVCRKHMNNGGFDKFCWAVWYKGFEMMMDVEYHINLGNVKQLTGDNFNKTCIVTMRTLQSIMVEHLNYSSNKLNLDIDQMLINNARSLNRTSKQKSAMNALMMTFVMSG